MSDLSATDVSPVALRSGGARRDPTGLASVLAERERFRDAYRARRDPIARSRVRWRAHAFRQLVHILPGQRILEIGSGDGLMVRALAQVTRGENPITALTFDQTSPQPRDTAQLRVVTADDFPGPLPPGSFDLIVATDMLDRRHSAEFLRGAHDLLAPGGQLVMYESNPWNPWLRLRRAVSGAFRESDPRQLLDRPMLYELLSEVGFVRVFAVFHDFLFAPLTPRLVWLLRSLSVILENTPGLRRFAGSILLHAQKPPAHAPRPRVPLTEHRSLHGAVSVVIPCHNEAMNVEPVVHALLAHFDAYLQQIVLVDDNSQDATRAVIARLARQEPRVTPVVRSPPPGVGRALADGYRAATGEWILSMDCDFLHLLPEVRDLFDAAAAGHRVVVGSRFSRSSVLLNYPLQKILANRGFHLLARLVLWRAFRDLTNNLKLVRRDVVERLVLREPGFAANAETGLQPFFLGESVTEIPISWINRTPGQGVSSFRLAKVGGGYWSVLRGLVRLRWFGTGPYRALRP